MSKTTIRLIQSSLICSLLILLSACGDGGTSTSSPSDFDPPLEPVNIGGDGDLFDPERLIDVKITLPAQDFAKLKAEGRTLASTARECPAEFEYTEFAAKVTIDGDTMDNVMVRKKGFMGSLSPSRPSLKLDFNDLHKGRTYQHMSRMTLNNNRQDASNARQCLGYDLFRSAGIHAPRCNFAKVSVNGEDLGIFTNVEPIKKPFLARTFGDDDGNLYEAQLSDFGTHLNDRFEKKTNKKENDRTDLQTVADALQLPDEQMMNVLPQLLDVDEFITFWALETLLGFWDSATGNANNFYIYRSPTDGRFHFIPWGADTAFNRTHLLKPDSGPLYRNFHLAARLYGMDTYRQQYLDTLEDLLQNHWDEAALQAELDRIRQLTGTPESAQESVIRFISGHGEPGDDDYLPSQRQRLASAIAGELPDGAVHLLEDVAPDCDTQPLTTQLTASIKASGGTDTGIFSFKLPGGQQVSASLTFAAFEVDSLVYTLSKETSPPVVSLLLIGADINDAFTPYVLQVFIEVTDYVPGTHVLHGLATNMLLFEVEQGDPVGINTLALGATGTITINSVGTGAQEGDVDLTMDVTLEYLPGIE